MATDELAEINGVKPNVYLADGEERDVSSMSRFACFHLGLWAASG
jgi:hypothetical protein